MNSLGPIVGHTHWTSSRIWVRSEAGVSEDVTLDPAEPGLHVTRVDLGRHVYRLELSGLSPGTSYRASIKDLTGAQIGLTAALRTGVPAPSMVRLWFGSCYNGVNGDQIWDTMYKRMPAAPPDALFLVGDQVYADEPQNWLPSTQMPYWSMEGAALEEAYESLYEKAWTNTQVARVLASVPTLMTWDDHELYDDWGTDPRHRRSDTRGNQQYATIEKVYRRYERAHGPGDVNATLDFGTKFGPVAVYTLDLRSERGMSSTSPIVGEAQHGRLQAFIDGLDSSTKILVVVTSVPVTFVNQRTIAAGMADLKDLDLDLADQWNYPGRQGVYFDNRPDLKRLFRTLFAWQRAGRKAIVIGGDVHMAYGHKVKSGQKEILSFATSPMACEPIGELEREILEAGVLFSNHEIVPGYRGAALVDEVIFAANFGELVFEPATRKYRFSIVTASQTLTIHEGKL
jgi:phosphodiesterase/alkaline phosphatase D-like protein